MDDAIRLFLLSFGGFWSFLFELGEEDVDPFDFKGNGFGIAREFRNTPSLATGFMHDLGGSEGARDGRTARADWGVGNPFAVVDAAEEAVLRVGAEGGEDVHIAMFWFVFVSLRC